jgi:dienelactone hydrolase
VIKKLLGALVAGFLAMLIIPVLVTQLTKSDDRRRLQGVELDDTDYREVSFENAEQGLRLAGMLFVPEGDGPFPAIVMIQGSGTSVRNNRWYLTLIQYLQENGIVVLQPDKRGSVQSEGDWRTASFDDLATDTLAAVFFLKDQEQVAISEIGLIGMSQGGHIAPLAADRSQDIAFLVNVVGGSVPMHDLLVYEETHNLRELGILPGLSNLLAYPSSWMVRNIAQPAFWDAIGNFDPLPYWSKLTLDALVLYGENDTNVPSSESARILESLGKPNIRVKIYPGSGHALESPTGEGNSIFRQDALKDIRDFVFSSTTTP